MSSKLYEGLFASTLPLFTERERYSFHRGIMPRKGSPVFAYTHLEPIATEGGQEIFVGYVIYAQSSGEIEPGYMKNLLEQWIFFVSKSYASGVFEDILSFFHFMIEQWTAYQKKWTLRCFFWGNLFLVDSFHDTLLYYKIHEEAMPLVWRNDNKKDHWAFVESLFSPQKEKDFFTWKKNALIETVSFPHQDWCILGSMFLYVEVMETKKISEHPISMSYLQEIFAEYGNQDKPGATLPDALQALGKTFRFFDSSAFPLAFLGISMHTPHEKRSASGQDQNKQAILEKASVLFRRNEKESAFQLYQQVIPTLWEVKMEYLQEYILLCQHQKRGQEAIYVLRRLLKENPYDPYYYHILAKLYEQENSAQAGVLFHKNKKKAQWLAGDLFLQTGQ